MTTASAATDGAALSVVVVDDHPVVREGLCRALERAGGITIVAAASSGREAVEAAREHRPHVVVMDLQMPDGDGIAATRSIVAAHPSVHVLILSTYGVQSDIVRAFEAGARGYLLKDAPMDRLVGAIRAVAGGEMVLSSPAAAHLLPRLQGKGQSSAPSLLTARELEILEHVAKGETNRAIARSLRISEATVKTHLLNAFGKLEVDDRTAAVTEALRRGMLRLGR